MAGQQAPEQCHAGVVLGDAWGCCKAQCGAHTSLALSSRRVLCSAAGTYLQAGNEH